MTSLRRRTGLAVKSGRILAFATQGTGGTDERRIVDLLEQAAPALFPFRRTRKFRSFLQLLRRLLQERPDLLVMEGTGLAGGAACVLGRLLARVPYVVSSGDAVAPWVGSQYPLLRPLVAVYEWLLCRLSAGFIGWTPYLVGRALSFGSPRGMTAAGWARFALSDEEHGKARRRVRRELGIPENAVVFGIIGSLAWHRRVRYCYGLELLRAHECCRRADVYLLIVGDGSGRAWLQRVAGERLGRSVLLPGAVDSGKVPEMLSAMDIASLPQSVDAVGSFRYTTKLSEYLAAGLPIVTGEIPLAYDLDGNWLWRLPGDSPWDPRYLTGLAALMEQVTPHEIAEKRRLVPHRPAMFDRERQAARVTAFVHDLLEAGRSSKAA